MLRLSTPHSTKSTQQPAVRRSWYMVSGITACLGGLCCVGGGFAYFALHRQRPRPAQRYMTVGEDEAEEDELLHEPRFSTGLDGDNDDESEAEGEEAELEPSQPPATDAFARGLAALRSGTREGDLIGDRQTAAGDISSESWIAEMNAELAEFDALTGTPSPVLSPTPAGTIRSGLVNREQGQRSATPT